MSRSWTTSECRKIGKALKSKGIMPYDYDEFCKLLDEGKIFAKPMDIAKKEDSNGK